MFHSWKTSKKNLTPSKALEEIKSFEESKEDISAMPGMAKKMTMAASKLPTILGGGDGDLKAQN